MPLLIDCPACARAIRRDESACPFCGAEQRRVEGPGSLRFLGVVLGLMSASCSEKPDPDTESTTVPTSTAQTTDGQATQNATAVTDQPTSTSTTTTSTTTTSTTTTSTTTSSSTTDGSASVSDSMDSFNVTTAYAAALETESAGAPPAVTEGDTEATTTGETQ